MGWTENKPHSHARGRGSELDLLGGWGVFVRFYSTDQLTRPQDTHCVSSLSLFPLQRPRIALEILLPPPFSVILSAPVWNTSSTVSPSVIVCVVGVATTPRFLSGSPTSWRQLTMNCLPTYWVIDLWHTLVGNVYLVSFSLPAPSLFAAARLQANGCCLHTRMLTAAV